MSYREYETRQAQALGVDPRKGVDMHQMLSTVIRCNPPRAYAHPATEPEIVWVPERTPPQTRTVFVLGIRVEIPLKVR